MGIQCFSLGDIQYKTDSCDNCICSLDGNFSPLRGATSWIADGVAATTSSSSDFSHGYGRRAAVQDERFDLLTQMAFTYGVVSISTLVCWNFAGPSKWTPVTVLFLGAASATTYYAIAKPRKLLIRPSAEAPAATGHYPFSLWASLSHIGFSGYNFGVQAMLANMAGPTALGIFHACRTLLQPVNTLVGAMDTIDKPRAARAYASNGRIGLIKAMQTALTILFLTGGLYIATIYLLDSWLLALVFGTQYSGAGSCCGGVVFSFNPNAHRSTH